jgi:hypothetical protein
MSLMDDLVGCLDGLTILGAAPDLGADARTFHRKLRDVLFRNPDEADRIGPRIEAVYRGLWPGAPPAVWRDCAKAHLKLACIRRDLGPAPTPAWHQPEAPAAREPLGNAARRRQILAKARPILNAERKRITAEIELAKEELRREYVYSRLNIPKRPRGGW